MAIPTGSGTEVLKVAHVAGVTNSENVLINGVANHIITVISITICEVAGTNEAFYLTVNDGASDIHLLNAQSISASSTFVWNDKIVLVGGDKLIIDTTTAANLDVLYTFIDQDWS